TLGGGSAMGLLTEFLLPAHTYGRYDLTDQLLVPVVTLYQKLRTLRAGKTPNPLMYSLRRFNLSYSREHADDILVDLAIALEGSLLAGEQTEIRYKLAHRGAALLRSQRDPHETAKAL